MGVGAIKKRAENAKSFANTGKKMEENQIQHVQKQLETFKVSLEEFASKHKKKINADPEFRHRFHLMCSSIGVDPLASGKGFWSDLLGVGDFYYELGVQIIQICVETRSSNGGMITMKEVLAHVRTKKRGASSSVAISAEDVKRAVEKISILNSGFKIIEMSNGKVMILSVPLELNNDHEELFSIASQRSSYLTEHMMSDLYGWPRERFYRVVNVLLQEGIVWLDSSMVDTPEEDHRFYFPSLWKEEVSLGHFSVEL